MNLISIALICIISFLYHSNKRSNVFAVFGGAMLCHSAISLYITSQIFFFISDALLLTCVCEVVRHIKPITKNSLFIQKICVFGIIVDMIGLALWFNYNSPVYYNLLYSVIYAIVLFVMMDRGINEPTSIRYGSWLSRIGRFSSKSISFSMVNKS